MGNETFYGDGLRQSGLFVHYSALSTRYSVFCLHFLLTDLQLSSFGVT